MSISGQCCPKVALAAPAFRSAALPQRACRVTPLHGNARCCRDPRSSKPHAADALDGFARAYRRHDKEDRKVPQGLAGEQVLFLGDVVPTGWQAVAQCDVALTNMMAIWGAGPVGQMAVRCALPIGARQVVVIDRIPERLPMATAAARSRPTSRTAR